MLVKSDAECESEIYKQKSPKKKTTFKLDRYFHSSIADICWCFKSRNISPRVCHERADESFVSESAFHHLYPPDHQSYEYDNFVATSDRNSKRRTRDFKKDLSCRTVQ